MKLALCLAAGALWLAAQPKLLVNAKVDSRSAAAGLEREFTALLAAQPQPAWIGFDAPIVRGYSLGCELVSPGGWWAPGVVHLEPPDHMVALFRVEASAVARVRTVSPDCEIDAGGLPVHWIAGVQPPAGVALLAGLAVRRERDGESAVKAIGLEPDPSADAALESLAAPTQPEWLRQRAVFWLGAAGGGRRFEVLKRLLAAGPPEPIAQRAIAGLQANPAPEAADLLVSLAREDSNARIRALAVSALGRKPGPKTLAALQAAIADPDVQVGRRAVASLQSRPDGEGVPLLIQAARSGRNDELRKQAMTALRQSRDPRAVTFFEEVLK